MILNDRLIRARVEGWDAKLLVPLKQLHIGPYDDTLVQPSSYDVRIGDTFRIFQTDRLGHIDPLSPEDCTVEVGPTGKFHLQPHGFALACTMETFGFPDDLVGHLEGKSSLARLGLLVHATAGYIDPGFCGSATLELSNLAPMPFIIHSGMLIGHMTFHTMEEPAEVSYRGKYQGQAGPTASAYWKNYPDGYVPRGVSGDPSSSSRDPLLLDSNVVLPHE